MAYKTHDELYRLFEPTGDKNFFFKVEKSVSSRHDNEPPQKRQLVEHGYELRANTLIPKSYKDTLREDILNSLSPISKQRMKLLFSADDKVQRKKDKEQERIDNAYSYFEPTEVGTHMELWVCSNIKCPGCKGDLIKYSSMSQPVVDVKCSNHLHNMTHGPKYYQIKATEKNKQMNGLKYFSLSRNYIKVGSRRFGQNAHEIKVSDGHKTKRVLIGYICIEYTKTEGSREIIIDGNTSFILMPNLSYTLQQGEPDKFYYRYINQKDSFPAVRFDPTLFYIIRFGLLSENPKFFRVNLDDKYDLYEPLQRPLFQQKYLKYKIKYLELKSKLKI